MRDAEYFARWVFPLTSCRVYDGDTLMDMVLDLGFGVSFKTTGRLSGINAPEVRGKMKADGIISRDWLKQSIESAISVHIQTISETSRRTLKGKYGRWIISVWADGVNLNEESVRLGYAKKARY